MSNIGNKQTLAKNLSYYVEKSGKTKKEIAEYVGVAASTFNEWTKGKKYPRIDRIEMLADYFGILKSDLIEKKADEEMQEKNDTAIGIVMRLGSDAEFCELVKLLYKIDEKQIRSVRDMLSSFIQ